MAKCLYCYQETDGEDFHPKCAKKIFGTTKIPILPYTRQNIGALATEIIKSRTTVTGVQAKLSMELSKGGKNLPDRFTIVGLWGGYILKPKSDKYPFLPENEDLTMHLAEIAKIETVPHCLIRFSDGELSYLTRRIDRDLSGKKYLMEDACQLSGRMSSDKYKSSYENIAKLIKKYSSVPLLDVTKFWEIVVFSWITGNSDMHLKNFSLISFEPNIYNLSAAYDLLNVHLVINDNEELALTLDGKKSNIKRQNFVNAMTNTGLDSKTIDNIFNKFVIIAPKWTAFIQNSFLPDAMKQAYIQTIEDNIKIFSHPAL